MDLPIIIEKNRKTNFPAVWPLFRPFLYKISQTSAAKSSGHTSFYSAPLALCSRIWGQLATQRGETNTILFCNSNSPPPPNYLLFVRCPEVSELQSAPGDVFGGPAPHATSTPFPTAPHPPPPILNLQANQVMQNLNLTD
jgi:hypothetical protein